MVDSKVASDNDVRARARQLTLAGYYEEAAALYRSLLALNSEPPAEDLAEMGFVCKQLGALDDAERCLAGVLAKHPQHSGALTNLVEMHLDIGRLDEETTSMLDRLRAQQPDNAEVALLAARMLFIKGATSEAKTLVGTVVARGSPSELGLAIKLLAEQGCFADAANAAQKGLSGNEIHPYVFQFGGHALISLNQLDAAIDLFSRARVRYPDRIFPLCGLAAVHMKRHEFSRVDELLDLALSRVPEHTEATYLRFISLTLQEKWTQLLSATEEFVSRDPPVLIAIGFHVTALKELGLKDRLQEFSRRS